MYYEDTLNLCSEGLQWAMLSMFMEGYTKYSYKVVCGMPLYPGCFCQVTINKCAKEIDASLV